MLSEEECLLRGLQVLDLADEKASFCSKLLADFGAEVIKIEPPGGDASRRIGPFQGNNPHSGKSLSFWYNNTNKLGITLNLETEEGREKFRQLAREADIVVEAFSPGYLERLGLDYGSLSRVNPNLILASICGFGQDGSHRHYKSCDIVASAMGGQMHVCGASDTPPLRPYGEQPYYLASLFAAIGILIALREREHSGEGQHIDISLQEAVAATLERVLVRYFYDGVVSQRQGREQTLPLILPCRDGYILLTIEREWDILVNLLESEDIVGELKEERWQEEEYRRQHWDHVVDTLSRWTKCHTKSELFELGQLMRFPWAPVSSFGEMANSPQLLARNFFVPVEHPERRTHFSYPGLPCKFFDKELSAINNQQSARRAPLIGEHNAQVYREKLRLGIDAMEKPSANRVSNKESKNHSLPLQGLRILDFTWLLAGPYATRILADFGAEVIKVQSQKTATGTECNATGYFNAWNRNKLAITLNMAHPEAKDIIHRLVEASDVVMENFAPRVMSNWGLSYEKLVEVKPDIIMLSMSGMGQTGPWRDFVALGPTIQALSSITYLTSAPGSPPSGLGHSYADPVAGLFAALAVLAALGYRSKTGRGLYIDISEYEAMCSLLGPAILDYTVNHSAATPQGNDPGYIPAAPYGCYKCVGEDRWCVIAVFTEEEWQALCRVLGDPAWSREEKFSTFSGRRRNSEELDKLLEQWTVKRTPEGIVNLLQQADICAGIVKDAEDLANDPQLKARNFFVQAEHPVLGKTISDGTPIKLSRTPAKFSRAAPLLGQDDHYVYRELLGMSEEELSRYIDEGAIS